MEVKIVSSCKSGRDPCPGQMWHPDDIEDVYMCISHHRGRSALGHTKTHAAQRFYSVNLCSGTLHDTPCGRSNTVLLKWVNGVPELITDTDC